MNERTNRTFSQSINQSQYIRHHLWTYTVRTLNKEIEMS